MGTIPRDAIKKQVNKWQREYNDLKSAMAEFTGDLSENRYLIEYNMLCVQALVLHECIAALMAVFTVKEYAESQPVPEFCPTSCGGVVTHEGGGVFCERCGYKEKL